MSFLEDKRDAALRMSERYALKTDASKPKSSTSSKSFHGQSDDFPTTDPPSSYQLFLINLMLCFVLFTNQTKHMILSLVVFSKQ